MRRNPRPGAVARVLLASVTGVVGLLVAGASPVSAADDTLTVEAAVDGRAVDGAGSSDPVEIDPATTQQIDLSLTNTSDDPVTVRRVRLRGDVGGLTLVAYDIGVDLRVDGGDTEELELPVEFIGLERQATGLLPGGLVVIDEDREEVGSQDFVIDVKGDTTSVMGLFAIFVTGVTIAAFIVLGIRTSRRTLIGNRARRALQFAAAGLRPRSDARARPVGAAGPGADCVGVDPAPRDPDGRGGGAGLHLARSPRLRAR